MNKQDEALAMVAISGMQSQVDHLRGQRDYLFGVMMMIRDMPHEAKRFASGAIESIRRQEEP